ncbi:tRNA pseudouridine synthase D [Backusella circina FSU 941]|nr:tRNA pseudouridine synthase D [Backusella circina FSU 941]
MGNLFSRSEQDTFKGNKRLIDSDETPVSKKPRTLQDDVVISEKTVGILSYVNPDIIGFHSILKYRAEDFLVNEVDMDNNIIHLTSLEGPVIPGKEPTELTVYEPSQFDQCVSALFDTTFSEQLRAFLDKPDQEDAVIETAADKMQRQEFYTLIENHLDTKIYARGKEGKLIIRWPSAEFNNEFIDWNAVGGKYLQVHLYKSGIDTMNAVTLLSKKSSAITVQMLTLDSVKPSNVLLAMDELKKSGLYVGDYKFVKNGLTLGDLGGNHFTIVLRDVKGSSTEQIVESLASLQQHGFLNYFGMQRFGTGSVCTHEIGCAIMKREFKKASDLIMNPRPGDRDEYAKARQLWVDTQDASATLAIFPKRGMSERKLLQYYLRNPGQHAKAIKSLPKNMLTLYSHAYQSYVWNRVVSERVKRYGCNKPLIGDIVMVQGKVITTGSQNSDVGRRDFANRKVPKILTEQDVNDYTIEDVVYPLPGRASVYPDNVVKDFYRDFMAEDGISIEKKDNHFQSLKGDYRYILAKPRNMAWSFIRYDDPTEKLCNTDVDRLENVPEPTGVQGNE